MPVDLHAPEITGVIQLAIAPVFMLTALAALIGALGAFAGAFVAVDISRTIAAMFICAMLALIASLLLFLREIFLAPARG